MGKSGLIGNKIAATLASTGTPSFSMHPGEAFHGDLGMVTPDGVFLAISNTGETEEIVKLLGFLKSNGNTLISMTGNPESTLAQNSSCHIYVGVEKEACPLQLAPTASTTAALAMGDALAVALMEATDFKPESFARFHPGGSLGKKLLERVSDVMITEELPFASQDCNLAELISTITRGSLGIAIILKNEQLIGIITDGDLRRALDNYQERSFSLKAMDIMSVNPKTVLKGGLVYDAYEYMDRLEVDKLLVVENEKVVGVLRK
ncbi:KpsF/GutQ family sugar-phosphate isomerase [Psychrosphaera haliotis]|uniref:KpsF/GutQ family sugar-phosphate isomerase n=1 Tax=Psychrosphaera haliotis TaxID=555083 RepID=UPI001E5E8B8B|nr:KpsF/GutQ family sugar-phosphate isomerase [Psychrosphaera haliotis]